MNVVIVGAGFGGITAATELAKLDIDDLRVTLIDKSLQFYVGLTKLWVATGERRADECQHSRELLGRDGLRFINSSISAADLVSKTLDIQGEALPYDRLIIACGLDVRPDLVEGLEEYGLDLYSMDGAARIYRALSQISSGTIELLICATPFKCPPAPYEAALMIDALLRRRGVRENIEMVVATSEPRPLPILPPDAGAMVRGLLEQRDIELRPGRKVTRVKSNLVEFDKSADRFNLLIAVPPHRSPQFVEAFSPLVGDAGLISVDRDSLRTSHEGVFAIGDVAAVTTYTDLPIPRAGVLAEAQGKVVASQIAAELLGTQPATFDGEGHCFLEVGGGEAYRIDGHFLDPKGPSFEVSEEPSSAMYEDKKEFEATRIKSWFGRD